MKGGWAALCREACHDTAMPARAHGHDMALAALRPRYGAGRAAGPRGELALGAGARTEAHGACGRDAAIRPLGPATWPAPYHDTAEDPATILRPCTRLGAPMRTWACLLGQLGAHAPGLFFFDLVFDSVMFLSHRLDPVHKHCSSQKFSKFF